MPSKRPPPPRPDRIRSIAGSFAWIDHRFLRQGFDMGLTRLEKLLYFLLIAVSNQDGVSFYSDRRLGELLSVRYPHELEGARNELAGRDLIAFWGGVCQVLQLPERPLPPGVYAEPPALLAGPAPPQASRPASRPDPAPRPPKPSGQPARRQEPRQQPPTEEWKSLARLLGWKGGPHK